MDRVQEVLSSSGSLASSLGRGCDLCRKSLVSYFTITRAAQVCGVVLLGQWGDRHCGHLGRGVVKSLQ
jgi:hypothetical protein